MYGGDGAVLHVVRDKKTLSFVLANYRVHRQTQKKRISGLDWIFQQCFCLFVLSSIQYIVNGKYRSQEQLY